MKTAIDFKKLTLGYDQQPAVSQLETNIKEGSLTAIVGPMEQASLLFLKALWEHSHR